MKKQGICPAFYIILNWYDYGARFYDPALGRFHTQDRFAEKYYGLSPYNYIAGNPIKYTDINGDSIIIRYKKEKIMYHKGKLTWAGGDRHGEAYDGKGLKIKKDGTTKLRGFLRKAVGALDAIRNGGESGAKLISNLENSNHFIFIGKGKNLAAVMNVTWSPGKKQSGLDVNGKTKRPSFIGLAHELAHAWDWAEDGKVDMATWYKSGGKSIPKAEQYATFIENKIRYENGIPLRKYYGKSIDYSTNKTDGTGKILKNINGAYGPKNIYGNHNFVRSEFFKGL